MTTHDTFFGSSKEWPKKEKSSSISAIMNIDKYLWVNKEELKTGGNPPKQQESETPRQARAPAPKVHKTRSGTVDR
ncbi:unnamed protein product [Caenorhabditis nigoni]